MGQAPRRLEDDSDDVLMYEHAVALTAHVAAQDLDRSGLVIVQVAKALALSGRHPPSSMPKTPIPTPINSGAPVASGKDESCPAAEEQSSLAAPAAAARTDAEAEKKGEELVDRLFSKPPRSAARQ